MLHFIVIHISQVFEFFHSVNDIAARPEVVAAISDEEDNGAAVGPIEFELSTPFSGMGKEQSLQVSSDIQLQNLTKKELDRKGSTEFPIKADTKPSDANESVITINISNQESNTDMEELMSQVNTQFGADGKLKVPLQKLYHERDRKQLPFSGGEGTKFKQSSMRASLLRAPSHEIMDLSKTELQRYAGFSSSAGSFGGKVPAASEDSNFQQLSNSASPLQGLSHNVKDLGKAEPQKLAGFGSSTISFGGKTPSHTAGDFHLSGKASLGKFGLTGLPSASSESLSSIKYFSPEDADTKDLLLSATLENSGCILAAANFSGDLGGKPFQLNNSTGISTSHNFSDRPVPSGEQRPSTASINIEPVPSIHSSQALSLENATSGKSVQYKHYPSKENHRFLPQSGLLNSEPNLSKQFGNVISQRDLCLHVTSFLPLTLISNDYHAHFCCLSLHYCCVLPCFACCFFKAA